MAQRFRSRPSDSLGISDGFSAYCFDEACCWILSQIEEGKRPFFGGTPAYAGRPACSNAQAVDLLRKLGAEVKIID